MNFAPEAGDIIAHAHYKLHSHVLIIALGFDINVVQLNSTYLCSYWGPGEVRLTIDMYVQTIY